MSAQRRSCHPSFAFLVALCPVQDLLLGAKHLFGAASRMRPAMGLRNPAAQQYRGVLFLSFKHEEVLGSETARLHCAHRRRGSRAFVKAVRQGRIKAVMDAY